jgi:hypothetical protein
LPLSETTGTAAEAAPQGGAQNGAPVGNTTADAAAALAPNAIFGLGRAPGVALTLRDQVVALLPTALRAGAAIVVSLGFVAAVGALMLWTRFGAAGLPADEAISVVPRDDLVAVGALLVVQYVAIGVAAVMLVRFRDRYGNASPATRRALADLVLVELLIAGYIVWDTTPETASETESHWLLAAVCLLAARGLLALSIRLTPIGPRYRAVLAEQHAIGEAWRAGHSARRAEQALEGLTSVRKWAVDPAAVDLEASVKASQTAEKSLAEARETNGAPPQPERREETHPTPSEQLAAFLRGATAGVAPSAPEGPQHAEALPDNGSVERLQRQAEAAALRVEKAETRLNAAEHLEEAASNRVRSALFLMRARYETAGEAERRLVERQVEARSDPTDRGHYPWLESTEWLPRLLLRVGAVALAILAAIATGDGWLVWLVIGVAALALATLGIAQATSDTRFFWTGVALFVSGLLFGALFTVLRTAESPKLSPVGLLMKPDAGKKCGRYVSGGFVARTGEGDADRTYYGNARRAGDDFTSGRVSSVSNGQIAAHAVGSLDRPYERNSASFAATLRSIKADLVRQSGISPCP